MVTRPNGPVVIATRGDPSSAAAVRVGGTFAAHHHRPLAVVAIVRPAVSSGILSAACAETVHDAACQAIASRVRAQLAETIPSVRATVSVELGDPVEGIVDYADTVGASLIVLGVGRHEALDRLLGLETAVSVMRRAHAPVLAVAHDAQVQTAVVALATDFGSAAFEAARVALEIAMPDAHVHLLHVAASCTEALPRLEALAERLPVTTHLHVLTGDPAHALTDFCGENGVELIALGSHGGRSLAEHVLCTAHCSVLVVPSYS